MLICGYAIGDFKMNPIRIYNEFQREKGDLNHDRFIGAECLIYWGFVLSVQKNNKLTVRTVEGHVFENVMPPSMLVNPNGVSQKPSIVKGTKILFARTPGAEPIGITCFQSTFEKNKTNVDRTDDFEAPPEGSWVLASPDGSSQISMFPDGIIRLARDFGRTQIGLFKDFISISAPSFQKTISGSGEIIEETYFSDSGVAGIKDKFVRRKKVSSRIGPLYSYVVTEEEGRVEDDIVYRWRLQDGTKTTQLSPTFKPFIEVIGRENGSFETVYTDGTLETGRVSFDNSTGSLESYFASKKYSHKINKDGSFDIKAADGKFSLTVAADGSKELKSNDVTITIDASNNISISGVNNLTAKCQNATIEAEGDANIKAGKTANIEAPAVNIGGKNGMGIVTEETFPACLITGAKILGSTSCKATK